MNLRYDEDFVEAAIFLCSTGRRQGISPLQIARFNREREKLYGILDPEERNTAFFKLHLEWFREWGLEKMILAPVDELPLLRSTLHSLVFRQARIKKDEGAELYVRQESDRTAVVALGVERFTQTESLNGFLRHELMHIHDMLDPVFGYSPQLNLPGRNAAQMVLTRERYRLLWDITIDGRLEALSRAAAGGRDRHRATFERAFGFWPEARRKEVFESLWTSKSPRHSDLLALASDPRNLKTEDGPTPGAPCPLCGFATFAWADSTQLTESAFEAIREEFPLWMPEQGACRRCAEIYRLRPSAARAIV
jgi:hypothetical protein